MGLGALAGHDNPRLDQDQQQLEPHPNYAIPHRETETAGKLFYFGEES